MVKSNWGGAYFILCSRDMVYHWENVQGRKWSRKHGGTLLMSLRLGSCSAAFLIQPKSLCLGWFCPQCSGPFYINLTIKKILHRHAFDGSKSLTARFTCWQPRLSHTLSHLILSPHSSLSGHSDPWIKSIRFPNISLFHNSFAHLTVKPSW